MTRYTSLIYLIASVTSSRHLLHSLVLDSAASLFCTVWFLRCLFHHNNSITKLLTLDPPSSVNMGITMGNLMGILIGILMGILMAGILTCCRSQGHGGCSGHARSAEHGHVPHRVRHRHGVQSVSYDAKWPLCTIGDTLERVGQKLLSLREEHVWHLR